MPDRRPLPDGAYRVRIFAGTGWIRRDKIAGRWHQPGNPEPLRLASPQPRDTHFVTDALYAAIEPFATQETGDAG